MKLGRLTRITDLRATWADEARHFTPWLAQPENLAVLSEHLGIGPEGLELEAVEKYVGPYKADILCRDTTNGKWVLVENQLERTDHNHLGQILTYAAGLDCKTIIWISKSVTPEHKVAIEWLNALSNDDTSFYALEIELWQIENSPIAPSFNTVVGPSTPARQAQTAKAGIADGELSPAKQELLQYWTEFEALLAARNGPVRPVTPLAQNWLVHSIGKAGVNLNSSLNRQEGWIRAEIYLTGTKAEGFFRQLVDQRAEIEHILGFSLEWYDVSAKDRRIFVSKIVPNITDRTTWNQQHNRLADRFDDLHKVFHDRVRALQ